MSLSGLPVVAFRGGRSCQRLGRRTRRSRHVALLLWLCLLGVRTHSAARTVFDGEDRNKFKGITEIELLEDGAHLVANGRLRLAQREFGANLIVGAAFSRPGRTTSSPRVVRSAVAELRDSA